MSAADRYRAEVSIAMHSEKIATGLRCMADFVEGEDMTLKKNHPAGYNGITDGVIWQQLLLFFFPILFGTFFQQLYNTADAMIVGQFVGKEALSAVGGTTGTLINR